jgi:ketosteroid isomerase-like protein
MQLPIHRELVEGFRARDAARIAALYAVDAYFTVPGRPDVFGREAITNMLVADFEDSDFNLELEERRTLVSAGGDFASTRGVFRLSYKDPQSGGVSSVGGRYVQVFRMTPNGKWEVVEDISSIGPPESSSI